jgi:hypothetical protein
MASLDLLENGCIAVMLWTASSCHMPLFDFYIMVDWSGGARRRGGRSDTIWLAHGRRTADTPLTNSPHSRTEAIALIEPVLERAIRILPSGWRSITIVVLSELPSVRELFSAMSNVAATVRDGQRNAVTPITMIGEGGIFGVDIEGKVLEGLATSDKTTIGRCL